MHEKSGRPRAALYGAAAAASEFAAKGAVSAGMQPENAHAFLSLRDASDFLQELLRPGDLALTKGRTSDHVGRLAFAQFGEIGCWVEGCGKKFECDDCPELRLRGQNAPPPLRLYTVNSL
jgi:hypothetical protein